MDENFFYEFWIGKKCTLKSILFMLLGTFSVKLNAQTSPFTLPTKLDTCKELSQLDERAAAEYVKYIYGEPADTSLFANSMCNCRYVEFWPNGQLHEEGNMSNCKRNGEWIEYGSEKRIMMITNYKDDLRDGQFISYYGNGKVAIKCFYEEDQFNGLSQRFDFDGNLVEETLYDMGWVVKQNTIKEWEPDGVIQYVWVNESGNDRKVGAYIWDDGKMVFLRDLDSDELKSGSPNVEKTKRAQGAYYQNKK